jgi:hypothetical protein
MDFSKLLMEHARLALLDVPSAHQRLNVTHASPKQPTTKTEHATAQLEHSSEWLQTASDTANNAFNTATSAQTA